MPNPQNEMQKQLMAQFFTGIMQSVQAKKQRMAQSQKEQALYEQGQNDKTYENKLKYFQELSKEDDPQLKRTGFEGLMKLGVIDKMPEMEKTNKWMNQFGKLGAGAQTALAKGIFPGNEDQTYGIEGLEGYGEIFKPGQIATYEASKNRTNVGAGDKSRTARRQELTAQLTSIDKELTDLTDSTGRIRNQARYNELLMKKGYVAAQLESLGKDKSKADPAMELLNEVLENLKLLRKSK